MRAWLIACFVPEQLASLVDAVALGAEPSFCMAHCNEAAQAVLTAGANNARC